MGTILYYQTQVVRRDQRKKDEVVSLLPLVAADTGVTDVNLGAVHLNDLDHDAPLTINDTAPGDPVLDFMWDELRQLRGKVRVHAFVGGAAPGTFTRLEADFASYYPLLRDFVREYELDGMDLDIEEEGWDMDDPTKAVRTVIDKLREDFPPEFTVSMAPGARELTQDQGGLSGVRYKELFETHGDEITRFHAQFYCGWGDMSTKDGYLHVVQESGIPADKVVAGVVTNDLHCGSYVDLATLTRVLEEVKEDCPGLAGVFGWEYHRSGGSEKDPEYRDKPWLWAREVSRALRG